MKRFVFALLLCLILPVSVPAADIKAALVEVFGHEGGLQCDRDDPGNWTGGVIGKGRAGCTKYGIATNTYPHEDIRNLSLERAGELYKRDFWDQLRLSEVRSQINATEIFDAAVNQGAGTLARRMQEAVNLSNESSDDITVDGAVGPLTIAKLNAVNQPLLYVNLVGLRYERYHAIAVKNPRMMKYFKSWLFRVKANVTKAVHTIEARR
jgi:lysozyme family protein